MVLHHLATVGLLLLSYCYNTHNAGEPELPSPAAARRQSGASTAPARRQYSASTAALMHGRTQSPSPRAGLTSTPPPSGTGAGVLILAMLNLSSPMLHLAKLANIMHLKWVPARMS